MPRLISSGARSDIYRIPASSRFNKSSSNFYNFVSKEWERNLILYNYYLAVSRQLEEVIEQIDMRVGPAGPAGPAGRVDVVLSGPSSYAIPFGVRYLPSTWDIKSTTTVQTSGLLYPGFGGLSIMAQGTSSGVPLDENQELGLFTIPSVSRIDVITWNRNSNRQFKVEVLRVRFDYFSTNIVSSHKVYGFRIKGDFAYGENDDDYSNVLSIAKRRIELIANNLVYQPGDRIAIRISEIRNSSNTLTDHNATNDNGIVMSILMTNTTTVANSNTITQGDCVFGRGATSGDVNILDLDAVGNNRTQVISPSNISSIEGTNVVANLSFYPVITYKYNDTISNNVEVFSFMVGLLQPNTAPVTFDNIRYFNILTNDEGTTETAIGAIGSNTNSITSNITYITNGTANSISNITFVIPYTTDSTEDTARIVYLRNVDGYDEGNLNIINQTTGNTCFNSESITNANIRILFANNTTETGFTTLANAENAYVNNLISLTS